MEVRCLRTVLEAKISQAEPKCKEEEGQEDLKQREISMEQLLVGFHLGRETAG